MPGLPRNDSLDLAGRAIVPAGDRPAETLIGRPFLGIRFSCTGQYLRVYRSASGDRYDARCPACGRTVRFRVGSGGSNQRFFEVRCGG